MRARGRAALLVAALSSFGAVAFARHTEDEHITDDTAWTLQGDKAWRIGLFDASVTLFDRLSLSTHTLPWLVRAPNLALKWRFLSSGSWHFATQLGFIRLDTGDFERAGPNAPVFSVTTAELSHSYVFNRKHQLSHNLVLTAVRVEGEVTEDTLRGAGEAGLTNLQYVAAYEYRFSRTLALVITGRYQLFSLLSGELRTIAHPDEFTTIEVVLGARDDTVVNFEHALSIVPSLNWSWDTFNLRLGLGYGNFNVPVVNFMLEQRSIIPELDLFWTF